MTQNITQNMTKNMTKKTVRKSHWTAVTSINLGIYWIIILKNCLEGCLAGPWSLRRFGPELGYGFCDVLAPGWAKASMTFWFLG